MSYLVELGKIAGVAGIALGIFLIIFRDVLRKSIFATLPAAESYRLLRLIILLTWVIAVLGIGAWWFGNQQQQSRIQTAGNWKTSPEFLKNLRIGRNRSYIISLAGTPPDSIETTIHQAAFKIDKYGDNCCGELILFYQKDILTAISAKYFKSPDFKFLLHTSAPENFVLGKSNYNSLGNTLIEKKDDFLGGVMSICYIENHYFGNPGDYNDFYFSTTLVADWFEPEKFKNRKDMPIHSILVTDGTLSCDPDSKKESSECTTPWDIACTYFDNLRLNWN